MRELKLFTHSSLLMKLHECTKFQEEILVKFIIEHLLEFIDKKRIKERLKITLQNQ